MVPKPFIFTAVFAATVSMAAACGFHTYAPQPTMVDRLLNSDHIVFARPDPENPFRFKVTEAFEGPMADVELPHLVDSAARRRFAADPEAQSLFARDGAYGPWLRIVYVGGEMKSVLPTFAFVSPLAASLATSSSRSLSKPATRRVRGRGMFVPHDAS